MKLVFGVSVQSRNETSKHGVGNKLITETQSVLLEKVNDQNNVDLSVSKTGSNTQKTFAWWKNSEQWILYTDVGEITEGDFQSEATILRERQLVPFAQQCPCSFYHNDKLLPGESQHGQIGQPFCSLDLMADNFFYSLNWKPALKERRFQDVKDI